MRLSIPADWPVGEPIPIRAQAHWLVCEEHCVPESAVLDLTLSTAATAGPTDPPTAEAVRAGARRAPRWDHRRRDRWRESPSGLRLSLPVAGLGPAPSAVRFFPASWGLIEPAADQPWRVTGDRLEIDLTPGEAATTADPGGLLVVTGADGSVRSFEVNAVRGTPGQAPPAPPAAPALGLPLALGLAFLGGLILNLMPCVFPVLAIKALSLAGQGGLSARERGAPRARLHRRGPGLLCRADRDPARRAGGGHRRRLGLPAPVPALRGAHGRCLSGAGAVARGRRHPGRPADGSGRGAGGGGGTAGAFGTGALAALVAAPCTAPFMGAALGYALTLAWPLALAILLALGLGLAAPFLALSLAPGLARRLPRPGVWMEHLKQFLAFPMFATAAWLVWVLSVQTGPTGVALVLAGMLVLSFGLWVRERTAMAAARLAAGRGRGGPGRAGGGPVARLRDRGRGRPRVRERAIPAAPGRTAGGTLCRPSASPRPAPRVGRSSST